MFQFSCNPSIVQVLFRNCLLKPCFDRRN
uniref:Uncharacterized protein n=1 Tax=Anguilla anguilla TaxID=7936 RepID=A0A0E9R9W1_ANGAN